MLHSIQIQPLLFLVFDRSRFSDQNEPVALVPFRQSEVGFIDTECLVDDGPVVVNTKSPNGYFYSAGDRSRETSAPCG